MSDVELERVFADLLTDELRSMSAAEYMLAMLLVKGVLGVEKLLVIARKTSPPAPPRDGEGGKTEMGADFVGCLANGTGENLPALRAQALDELKSEFPTVFMFLEEHYGCHVRVPVFGRN